MGNLLVQFLDDTRVFIPGGSARLKLYHLGRFKTQTTLWPGQAAWRFVLGECNSYNRPSLGTWSPWR